MDATTTDPPPYTATVEDVANTYGVSTRTVRRWLVKKNLPHRKIGGVVRFNLEEVDLWARRSS